MGCTDPLRERGFPLEKEGWCTPPVCSRFSSKLTLPLYADMRAHYVASLHSFRYDVGSGSTNQWQHSIWSGARYTRSDGDAGDVTRRVRI